MAAQRPALPSFRDWLQDEEDKQLKQYQQDMKGYDPVLDGEAPPPPPVERFTGGGLSFKDFSRQYDADKAAGLLQPPQDYQALLQALQAPSGPGLAGSPTVPLSQRVKADVSQMTPKAQQTARATQAQALASRLGVTPAMNRQQQNQAYAEVDKLAEAIVSGRQDVSQMRPEDIPWAQLSFKAGQRTFPFAADPFWEQLQALAAVDPQRAHQYLNEWTSAARLSGPAAARQQLNAPSFTGGLEQGKESGFTLGAVPLAPGRTFGESAGQVLGSILGAIPGLFAGHEVGGAPVQQAASMAMPNVAARAAAEHGQPIAKALMRAISAGGTGLATGVMGEGARQVIDGKEYNPAEAPGRIASSVGNYALFGALSPTAESIMGKTGLEKVAEAISARSPYLGNIFAQGTEAAITGGMAAGVEGLAKAPFDPQARSISGFIKAVLDNAGQEATEDIVMAIAFGVTNGRIRPTENDIVRAAQDLKNNLQTQNQTEMVKPTQIDRMSVLQNIYPGMPTDRRALLAQDLAHLTDAEFAQFTANLQANTARPVAPSPAPKPEIPYAETETQLTPAGKAAPAQPTPTKAPQPLTGPTPSAELAALKQAADAELAQVLQMFNVPDGNMALQTEARNQARQYLLANPNSAFSQYDRALRGAPVVTPATQPKAPQTPAAPPAATTPPASTSAPQTAPQTPTGAPAPLMVRQGSKVLVDGREGVHVVIGIDKKGIKVRPVGVKGARPVRVPREQLRTVPPPEPKAKPPGTPAAPEPSQQAAQPVPPVPQPQPVADESKAQPVPPTTREQEQEAAKRAMAGANEAPPPQLDQGPNQQVEGEGEPVLESQTKRQQPQARSFGVTVKQGDQVQVSGRDGLYDVIEAKDSAFVKVRPAGKPDATPMPVGRAMLQPAPEQPQPNGPDQLAQTGEPAGATPASAQQPAAKPTKEERAEHIRRFREAAQGVLKPAWISNVVRSYRTPDPEVMQQVYVAENGDVAEVSRHPQADWNSVAIFGNNGLIQTRTHDGAERWQQEMAAGRWRLLYDFTSKVGEPTAETTPQPEPPPVPAPPAVLTDAQRQEVEAMKRRVGENNLDFTAYRVVRLKSGQVRFEYEKPNGHKGQITLFEEGGTGSNAGMGAIKPEEIAQVIEEGDFPKQEKQRSEQPKQPEPAPNKEPWQMTRKEFIEAARQSYPTQSKDKNGKFQATWDPALHPMQYGDKHNRAVIAALEAGKPVPPEVLADYPALTKKADQQPEPPPADTKRLSPVETPADYSGPVEVHITKIQGGKWQARVIWRGQNGDTEVNPGGNNPVDLLRRQAGARVVTWNGRKLTLEQIVKKLEGAMVDPEKGNTVAAMRANAPYQEAITKFREAMPTATPKAAAEKPAAAKPEAPAKEAYEMTQAQAIERALAEDQNYQNTLKHRQDSPDVIASVREQVTKRAIDKHSVAVTLAFAEGKLISPENVQKYLSTQPAYTFSLRQWVHKAGGNVADLAQPFSKWSAKTKQAKFEQMRAIMKAIEAGDTVPMRVLEDYPDLQTQALRARSGRIQEPLEWQRPNNDTWTSGDYKITKWAAEGKGGAQGRKGTVYQYGVTVKGEPVSQAPFWSLEDAKKAAQTHVQRQRIEAEKQAELPPATQAAPKAQTEKPTEKPIEQAAKEPWEMTYSEFVNKAGSEYTAGQRFGIPSKNGGILKPDGTMERGAVAEERIHRAIIRKALNEGKAIPEAVLAEYPDLRQSTQQPAKTSQPSSKPITPKAAESKPPWEMTAEEYAPEKPDWPAPSKSELEAWAKARQSKLREWRDIVDRAYDEGKPIAEGNRPEWSMTAEEAAARSGDSVDKTFRAHHRDLVRQALEKGYKVPAPVLAEYPEFAEQKAEGLPKLPDPADFTKSGTETQKKVALRAAKEIDARAEKIAAGGATYQPGYAPKPTAEHRAQAMDELARMASSAYTTFLNDATQKHGLQRVRDSYVNAWTESQTKVEVQESFAQQDRLARRTPKVDKTPTVSDDGTPSAYWQKQAKGPDKLMVVDTTAGDVFVGMGPIIERAESRAARKLDASRWTHVDKEMPEGMLPKLAEARYDLSKAPTALMTGPLGDKRVFKVGPGNPIVIQEEYVAYARRRGYTLRATGDEGKPVLMVADGKVQGYIMPWRVNPDGVGMEKVRTALGVNRRWTRDMTEPNDSAIALMPPEPDPGEQTSLADINRSFAEMAASSMPASPALQAVAGAMKHNTDRQTTKERVAGAKSWVADQVNAYIEGFHDPNAPLGRGMKQALDARKAEGKAVPSMAELPTRKNPAMLMEHLPNTAPAKAQAYWRKLGDALNPVGQAQTEYFAYAAAKRAVTRTWVDPETKQQRVGMADDQLPEGMTLAEAQTLVQEMESRPDAKLFTDALAKEQRLRFELLDEMVAEGMKTKEEVEALKKADPYWEPWYRDPEDVARLRQESAKSQNVGTPGMGQSAGSVGTAIKRFKGSKARLLDGLERRLRYYGRAASLLEYNKVWQGLYEFHREFDTENALLRDVNPPAEKVTAALTREVVLPDGTVEVRSTDILDQLEDLGFDSADLADPHGVLTFFKPTWIDDNRTTVRSFFYQGKRKYVNVMNEGVLRVFTETDQVTRNFLAHGLQKLAKGYKFGATVTPSFTIANLVKDTLSSWGFSKRQVLPGHAFWAAVKLWRSNDPVLARVIDAGLKQGGWMAPDRLSVDMARDIADPAGFVVKDPRKAAKYLWDLYTRFREGTEFVTRLGEFALEYKAQKAEGVTEEDAFWRAYNSAKRITLNFTRKGRVIRQVEKYVPFSSLPFESATRIAETLGSKEKGLGGLQHRQIFGLKMVLGSLALGMAAALIGQDDEQKKQAPDLERDRYFLIPMGKALFRVPKPEGLQGVMINAVERSLRMWAQEDPAAFKQFGESMYGSLFPQVTNPALDLLVAVSTGYDMQEGRPIVPTREQQLPKLEQYGPDTSWTARTAAQALPGAFRSPRVTQFAIDKLIPGFSEGYFQAERALRKDQAPNRRIPGWGPIGEDSFAVGRFLSRPGQGKQGRSVGLFYDQLEKADAIYQQVRRDIEKATGREVVMDRLSPAQVRARSAAMQRLSEEERKLFAAKKHMDKANDRMSTVRKRLETARASTTLTADEKRREIERLNQYLTEMAQRALEGTV